MSFCRKPVRPVVYPTQVNPVNTANVVKVPHIHPSHTVFNHHQKFVHVHYYPHTTSAQNFVTHQHVHAPGPGPLGPVRRPFW
ncbi:CotD family spore coat protein [Bacillus sp. AK128]